ncbi:MAG: Trk system potassium transporter TrkA [Myxococcota bacterium]|jgi:trk system potassium uptake protein TrkA|nr:Trk system potassium transporter TrkA [Myxococcota bacterium]
MRTVVLGAGEVGSHVCRELSSVGTDIVLVDRDKGALAKAEESLDVLTVHGDVTHRSVLAAAEIERADLAVAVTGDDAVNIVAAGLCASLGARRTAARVDDPHFLQGEAGVEAGVLGIHSLLCGARLVSEELLRLVEQQDAVYVGHLCANAVQVCVMPVTAHSELSGKRVVEVRHGDRVSIPAVVRDGVLRLAAEIPLLEVDDALVLTGPPAAVAASLSRLSHGKDRRRAVVVGGGEVGLSTARLLIGAFIDVKLVEQDRHRCEELAALLPKAEIVHGDGTSLSFLRDERIEDASFLVAATKADEVNLMVSLLAKDIGVPRTVALVHRPGYSDVYAHLGLRGAVGPHEVIARIASWLAPTRKTGAHSMVTGTGHALVEIAIESPPSSVLFLKDIALPPDSYVVAMARGNACLFAEESPRLALGDRLVVACPLTMVPDVVRRMHKVGGRG